MKHSITIYEKPTCSTCRQVKKAFDEQGINVEYVNYVIAPLDAATLTSIVAGLDVEPRLLVRTKEPEYKALGVDVASMTPAQIVDLLVAHPLLMQRPVIAYRGKYVMGRPVDKIIEFIKTMA